MRDANERLLDMVEAIERIESMLPRAGKVLSKMS
jgi:hypothetical protein